MSNSLDPDKARHYVRPDLGPNCFQRLSADNTSGQRVRRGFRKVNLLGATFVPFVMLHLNFILVYYFMVINVVSFFICLCTLVAYIYIETILTLIRVHIVCCYDKIVRSAYV